MSRKNKPELLAPAGDAEAFIAAVENGADAVYVGGRAFNARMNAGNFDDVTMQQALDYAHKRGVKVFVTVNTLLRDEELDEAMDYVRFLYQAGADALIIQDLGLGYRIGRDLPDFPRHLSTQDTSCDLETVRAAAELGYERVVLSRELSLPEIRKICAEKTADIEVFVHGALCICYSGQCQMSRYYGGRSGNRGACAQPCRLPYEGLQDGGARTEGHLLSPRDLCLIDDIGALIDAGVKSFKIEGRMKQPEYVAVVTRIYRKYIDAYLERGMYAVSEEDRRELQQIFNRGGFTEAYLNGDPGDALMSPDIAKNQGVRIGTVDSAKKGSELVDIQVDEMPEIGDGIEIRREGRRTASHIMTYRKELPDGRIRIGDFSGDIRTGDIVYRTSSKKQMDEARRTFWRKALNDEPEDRKTGRRRPIEMTLTCFNGMLSLEASTFAESEWASQRRARASASAGPFEYGEDHRTPKERFENALRKTGNTPFEPVRIRLKGEFDRRIRASEINRLRRECLSKLEENLTFRRTLPDPAAPETGETIPDSLRKPMAEQIPDDVKAEWFFHTLSAWKKKREELEVSGRYRERTEGIRVLLPLAGLLLQAETEQKTLRDVLLGADPGGCFEVVPYISNVCKGREDSILESNIDEIRDTLKGRAVYAGNLGWIRRLTAAGIPVTADYGINIMNRAAAEALQELGAAGIAWSLEADENPKAHGAFPLMVSQHGFPEEEIRNEARGISARWIRRPYSDQMMLVPVRGEGAGSGSDGTGRLDAEERGGRWFFA